jgi:hypothetical protein
VTMPSIRVTHTSATASAATASAASSLEPPQASASDRRVAVFLGRARTWPGDDAERPGGTGSEIRPRIGARVDYAAAVHAAGSPFASP